MARTLTLAEMEEGARRLADEEDEVDRFPQAEVWDYLNQGIAELWDLLVMARGAAYYARPYNYAPAFTQSGSGAPIEIESDDIPYGDYQIVIQIVSGGVLESSTFKYSLNGGQTWSTSLNGATSSLEAVPTAAVSTINGTNMTLYMSEGDYVADETYTSNVSARITTYSGQRSYFLPADFYKIHSIMLLTSGTTLTNTSGYMMLEPMDSRREAELRDGTIIAGCLPRFYDTDAAGLNLYPVPTSSNPIYLRYVPYAKVLTAETETFDGINGWELYPMTFAALQMMTKNDDASAAAPLIAQLGRLNSRIKAMATTRDTGSPERVKDVRAARSFASWRGLYR